MSNPIDFQSKSQIACQKHLQNYIYLARHVSPTWKNHPGFDWSSDVWHTPRGNLRFMTYGVKLQASKLPTRDQQFDPDFMEFAKAYILNTRNGNPAKAFRADYLAVQIVNAALIAVDGHADITRLSERHLDKAVEIIKQREKRHQAAAVAVKALARVVADQNISPHSIKYWESPFNDNSQSESAKPVKQSLPDDEALLALAEIFSRGYHSDDLDDEVVYITSITAILLSVPMRIAEKLWLRLDSIKSDKDKKGDMQWYLHYYSTKNKKIRTKGIPATMVEHCKEAFRRLTTITEPGRKLALHIESGSTEFYPHPSLPSVPADQILSKDEAISALGRPTVKSAEQLMKQMIGSYVLEGWTLNTLWEVVRAYNLKINPFFPYQVDPTLNTTKPPKMAESLLCFLKSQIGGQVATSPVLLAPMNLHYYAIRVAPDKIIKHEKKDYVAPSFFTRQGYAGLSIRSHQLRHFLNTAAKEAGVGIETITKWSGRASVKQTRDYIHQDPMRKAEMYSADVVPVKDVTPNPITAAEYSIINKGPIISTRYGICTHPWTISPCQKSGDCLNCSDLLHCKGHKNSLAAVKVERDHVAENLTATVKEIEAGNRPATRWVETHTRYLERLNEIVAMHEDPNIPDGSPVQMVGKDFTHAKRIMLNKQPKAELTNNHGSALSGIDDEDLQLCLQEMMSGN
jgi:hypothetical protein